ncbi:MAG: cupin domain-containing protein [Ardenticatenales bacterium]|nr:cupin domain-containing protein [Ardenticatenales bacterium]
MTQDFLFLSHGEGQSVSQSETFYILDGTLTFQLDEEPGAMVSIPRELRHAFANRGERHVRALILAAPAGLERYFADLSAMIQEGSASAELNRQYGLEFEG